MNAKADLHVHSKHSNRPTEWVLRQLMAPESFSEPLEVYRLCRERGMDFVTVSDHDTLAGSLEIAHLPGTFLSSEVTVAFPEDGCHIHLLVTGVTEAQFRDIARLRGNVYELRDYLAQEDVIASVAHPLFRVNDRLTLAHLEKLLVLFNRFEVLNGIHDRLANDLARRLLGALTPEAVLDIAERHGLEPWGWGWGQPPWIKHATGGSDDHGGFYGATTWTETPRAASVEQFLAHLRAGASEAGGATGSSLRLTQSLYSITYEYWRRRFLPLLGRRSDPFARLLRELARRPGEAAERPRGLARLTSWARRGSREVRAAGPRGPRGESPELDLGGFTSRASREALWALVRDAVRHARRGRLAQSLGAVAHLAPLGLAVAPFLIALRAQHKDADLLTQVGHRFLGPDFSLRHGGTAWLADGVAPAGEPDDPAAERARRMLAAALGARRDRLVALACGPEPDLASHFRVVRFAPLGELPLSGLGPGLGGSRLALPPLVEVLEHCERERYSELLISAPGPLSLLGLAAGKLLGLRLVGLCDPDLPPALYRATGDYSMAEVAWDSLRWFYNQMDVIHVPTAEDAESLAARGFDPAKLAPLGPPAATGPERARPAYPWRDEPAEDDGETLAA